MAESPCGRFRPTGCFPTPDRNSADAAPSLAWPSWCRIVRRPGCRTIDAHGCREERGSSRWTCCSDAATTCWCARSSCWGVAWRWNVRGGHSRCWPGWCCRSTCTGSGACRQGMTTSLPAGVASAPIFRMASHGTNPAPPRVFAVANAASGNDATGNTWSATKTTCTGTSITSTSTRW